ncbi:MAG: protein-glutamate O-methyltransferase CheR [Desulfuromonadales bacterium]|nr:MAG: protein-glutamate O-methyltransferase CheR [Desulfuromonadales bacterium]
MTHHRLIPALPEEISFDFPDGAFARVREILKARRDFDIGSYKDKYMKRRIAIRVRATHAVSVDDYCELLARSDGEQELLLKGLTIHVSQFFRNRPAFEKLREAVFPALFARLRQEGREEVTIWSVGCASGEEPYSLAIILRDSFAEELKKFKVSLVATDIHEGILDVARKGVYGPERLQDIPDGVLDRWFTKVGEKFELAPPIREMVAFRRGDLFDPVSIIESDLILCRNVLIYFERSEQERILNGFALALRTGGVLVLGKAETLVGETRRRFTTLCPVERMYVKNRFSAY